MSLWAGWCVPLCLCLASCGSVAAPLLPESPGPARQRGCDRGAVMFALPALFPTLALYDDVPVLVAACSSSFPFGLGHGVQELPLSHTAAPEPTAPVPCPPFQFLHPRLHARGVWRELGGCAARVCRFAAPGLVPALSVPSSPCDSTNESRCSFQARPHPALCGCSHFLFEYAISHTIAATA